MVDRIESQLSDNDAAGKYIFELYKFLTKVQIVNDGRPISFDLFRRLYQTRRLGGVHRAFVDYLRRRLRLD